MALPDGAPLAERRYRWLLIPCKKQREQRGGRPVQEGQSRNPLAETGSFLPARRRSF